MQPPQNDPQTPDAALAVILDILAEAKPGPDGAPDDGAWASVQQVLDHVEAQSSPQEGCKPLGKLRVPDLLAHPTPGLEQFLSLEEHYGSEPPGPGWTSAGAGLWTREVATPRKRVAVVGGGPGGLFTAYILGLKCPGLHVTLFEASGRLGGKIRTCHFSDGTPYEAGVAELYEYLGPGGRDPLRQLIEDDLGLDTVDMSGGGVVLGSDVLRDQGDLEAYHGTETRRAVEAFHRKCAALMPLSQYANRWQMDNAHPWAPLTFLECLEREIPEDEVARRYIKAAIHTDLATEPWTCNGLNGIKNVLMDNSEYMQLYHVRGGIERVVEALVSRLACEVRVNCRATGVGKKAGSYCVRWRCDDGDCEENFEAVVVAMPNHWLSQVCWEEPSLCAAMHAVCAHYDLPAHYLRVSFRFKTAWWKTMGMPGDYWMMDCWSGCCVYDESTRWRSVTGHILSFLIAGQDALLLCSNNQDDASIAACVLDRLPDFMRWQAKAEVLESRVERYVGSINAQPGGWPAAELVGEHQPDPDGCPGVFLCGDYFFDSTLNAALISAGVATDLLAEYLGVQAGEGSLATSAVGVDHGTV